MSEPGRCDISAVAVESIARPVEQVSAGGGGVLTLSTDADPAGRVLPSSAKSERSLERRFAFEAWRRHGQFSSIVHDGEAKPIPGGRVANPSGRSVGAPVAEPGAYYPGLDNASVCRGQLGPGGGGDSKKRSGRPPSTSMPTARRVPKNSWQRKAVSRRPRNRVGLSARELFNSVPRRDLSGLQRFLHGGHVNIALLWHDNRLLGLDPRDWLVLVAGSAVSGALVLLS
jgi:hypothetical protein